MVGLISPLLSDQMRGAVRFIPAALLALFPASGLAQAIGDLVVTPTRISLSDSTHAGSITVVNRGRRAIRYRLNLVDMEMAEDGRLKRGSTATTNSAIQLLRMSPREVVLEPGGFQRIRIMATIPEGTPAGEYRSHLSFEPVIRRIDPNQNTPTDGGNAVQFKIETLAIITIPVTVQHGRTNALATISKLQVDKTADGYCADVTLERAGNRTFRGDLVLSFIASTGKRSEIARLDSVPIYFPNANRNAKLAIKQDLFKLGPGRIEAVFTESDHGRGAYSTRFECKWPGN